MAKPILILDSCTIGRKGLESLIREHEHLLNAEGVTLHTAANFQTCPQTFEPEIVILVVRVWLIEALSHLEQLDALFPRAKIVLGDCDLLSDDETRDMVVKRCIAQGLCGYFSHRTSEPGILKVLREALQGENISLQNIRLHKSAMSANSSPINGFFRLSEREREILVLLTQNLSNTEIAEHLVIDQRTVESHKHNIRQKFGVKSGFALISLELASLINVLGKCPNLLGNSLLQTSHSAKKPAKKAGRT